MSWDIVGRIALIVRVLPRIEDAHDVATEALNKRLSETIGGAE